MPWGSRRAAALLKSGGSRSSLAGSGSLSLSDRAAAPRASPASPGRAEPWAPQSRAGLGAEPGWEKLPTQSPAPGAARTPQYHTARHAAAPPACDRRSCALALALALTLTLTHANV